MIDSITCPKCGSPDLAEAGNERLRCNHCGAYSVMADHADQVRILEWTCPKCGFDNERDSDFCGKCRESLTQECDNCRTKIRWDLIYCPECGFGIAPDEEVYYRKRFFPRGIRIVTNRRIIDTTSWLRHIEVESSKVRDLEFIPPKRFKIFNVPGVKFRVPDSGEHKQHSKWVDLSQYCIRLSSPSKAEYNEFKDAIIKSVESSG